MRAEMAFDVMERILPHLSAILNDADGKALMAEIRQDKNRPAGEVMNSLLPYFIGPHREDVFGIVAGMKGCTIEEAHNMDLKELNAVLRDNITGDMLSFFGSCLTMARCM